jgi:hypothetical protein
VRRFQAAIVVVVVPSVAHGKQNADLLEDGTKERQTRAMLSAQGGTDAQVPVKAWETDCKVPQLTCELVIAALHIRLSPPLIPPTPTHRLYSLWLAFSINIYELYLNGFALFI